MLDICCGTGDLVLALDASAGRTRARQRLLPSDAGCGAPQEGIENNAPVLFESDALLPLRDASLDLLTVAFGFRNLANYEAGLRRDAPRPAAGGVAAILEFSQPPNALFGALYRCSRRRCCPGSAG